jgi:predicted PurR-regulated permease PerM
VTQRELIARTVTILGLVILAWILVGFIRQTIDVLVLLLISAILAAGFAPLVSFVEERWHLPGGIRFSRGAAILILYLGIFLVIGVLLSMIIVPMAQQAAGFIQQLPQFIGELRRWLIELRVRWPWLPDLAGMLEHLPSEISSLSRYGPEAAGVAFRFIGGIAAAITVLVFTYYMLVEGGQMKRAFLALFPPYDRPRVDLILQRIGIKFGGWLRGQIVLSLSVAAPVAIGLALIGMPYAFLLGVIAGLGELIPIVGPTLGGAAAILVALSQPAWRLVAVVIFYTIIMNVEPHILVPRIMGQAIGLSPLLTLVALLSGIKLMGILGGLLSIPLAAALQVIVGEVVREIETRPIEPPARKEPAATPARGREPR